MLFILCACWKEGPLLVFTYQLHSMACHAQLYFYRLPFFTACDRSECACNLEECLAMSYLSR